VLLCLLWGGVWVLWLGFFWCVGFYRSHFIPSGSLLGFPSLLSVPLFSHSSPPFGQVPRIHRRLSATPFRNCLFFKKTLRKFSVPSLCLVYLLRLCFFFLPRLPLSSAPFKGAHVQGGVVFLFWVVVFFFGGGCKLNLLLPFFFKKFI